MKKEIIDFIRAIANVRRNHGNCTCFEAAAVFPYFMAISQEDIDFYNQKLMEILRAEGLFKEYPHLEKEMEEDFEYLGVNTTEHPIMGRVRSCFLRNKNEVDEKAKNDFHLFTNPYCAEMDTLILRLIQVFSS
ncbi:MAG: hypothetical protein WA064_05030 [Candidatus Moraniibacteriota bacterium]